MSRFSRPRFTAPAIPSPPPAAGIVNRAVSAVRALVNGALRLPSFRPASFQEVNPVLAQLKAQIGVQKENALKTKLRARAAVSPVPDLGVSSSQLSAFRAEAKAALRQEDAPYDEFGRPKRTNR